MERERKEGDRITKKKRESACAPGRERESRESLARVGSALYLKRDIMHHLIHLVDHLAVLLASFGDPTALKEQGIR